MFTPGQPSYGYDPNQPFGCVEFEFLLTDASTVNGYAMSHPEYPHDQFMYYTKTGERIHKDSIAAYRYVTPVSPTHTHHLPYGYENRSALKTVVGENVAFHILAQLQGLIDCTFWVQSTSPYKGRLMDLIAISPDDEGLFEATVKAINAKSWDFMEALCTIRDKYREKQTK